MNIRNTTAHALFSFVVFGVLTAAYPSSVRNAGDACKPRSIFCADGDGTSTRYLKCVHEKLVEGFCPQDSICVGSKDTTIFCATDRSNNLQSINSPIMMSAEPTTTLTVIVHQSHPAHAFAPAPLPSIAYSSPKPPVLLLASRTSAQQQQQLMVPTSLSIESPQASPVSSFVFAHHSSFNNGQMIQHQEPTLHQPTPASSIQNAHQKSWNPASQETQANPKPHNVPFFAATSSANFNNVARPPSLHSGGAPYAAPTMVPDTKYRHNLQQPQPKGGLQHPHAMMGSPSALQMDGGFNPAPTQPLIGGIEAERVLSVVGNAIFSQIAQSPTAGRETHSVVSSSAVETQQLTPSPAAASSSNARTANANTIPPNAAPLANAITPPPANNPMAYLPQPLPPPVCTPGSFVCAMHGLELGYFACDSAGVALPAACAFNEVCYQYGQSILCAAPGRAPEANVLLK